MWSLLESYNLSPEQVSITLERVLGGNMDCREWDNFISIPIKGNPDMEAVRAKCQALSAEEHIDPSGIISHSVNARLELVQILQGLKSAT